MAEAENDPRAPAVHVADSQTEGVGRRGRRWMSPPGNLYATIVWPQPEDPAPGLLAAIQVAWVETVAGAGGPHTLCKWPNDGIVEGGKWAGALARRAGGRLLLGLGANLEQAPAELGEGSEPRGTLPARALADHWRPWPGLGTVACLLLAGALDVLREGPAGVAARLARWPLHDALAPGEEIRVETPDATREGRYLGVAPDGRLRLEADGALVLLAAGDVARLRARSAPRPPLS